LSSVKPPIMDWRIKARVVRLWNNESEMVPEKVNSSEKILVDQDVIVSCFLYLYTSMNLFLCVVFMEIVLYF